MIPQTFNEWIDCMVNDCKIKLTKDFVQQRLTIYENQHHKETQHFIGLYGKQHLTNIINWLNQVKDGKH